MKNYYEILEVNENASKEVIEKAYKVLIKKYHPDLYKNDEKKIAEQKLSDINESYKILSDNFLREQYDRELVKMKAEKYLNELETNVNNKENYNNSRKKQNQAKSKIQINNKNNSANVRKSDVGSFRGIIGVVQEVFKSRPKKEDFQRLGKVDFLALVLTIVCLIIIGIILWFIPFTNGWMRQLIFENPLISWIF